MRKFDSTALAQTAKAKTPDEIEKEIQKADLDLLDKINKVQAAFDVFSGTAGTGPFVPLLPNPLISGEPSLGTPHPHAEVAILGAAGPADTGWHAIDVVALGYPTGVRAIQLRMACRDSTNGRTLSASNADGGVVYAIAAVLFSTLDAWFVGICPVDSSGQIWYKQSNASMPTLTIKGNLYWM